MAEKSTFFNSVNGDRKYTAEDMAAHFAKMLTNGVMPAGTQLQAIESSGMNVAITAGSAWINGYAYHNDASFVLAIDPADGALNRVDRIVVRWSKLARSINLIVLKGTPASSAAAPAITRNADYYDLSIATINVNKGITAITQALITDTRMDSDVCGFVSSLIQPDTSGWFVQFETAFNEWFDGVKDILGNDVAGNLQNQINELLTQVREIKTLNGVASPTTSTVGAVGQFYLDTTTKTLYQCVAVDEGTYTWENSAPCIMGVSDPTVDTLGRIGQFYYNTTTGAFFQCVAISENRYTWEVQNGDQIGDIRLSKKPSLGDKYLATNGQQINSIDQSVLFNILPGTGVWRSSNLYYVSGSNSINISNIYSGYMGICNGCYTFPSLVYSKTDKNYRLRIYYSIDGSNWSWANLTPTPQRFRPMSKVIWTGTHYMFLATDLGNPAKWYSFYSASIDKGWSSAESPMVFSGLNFFDYIGGKVVCKAYTNAYYNPNPASPVTWASVRYTPITDIFYRENTWIILNNSSKEILISDALNGSWNRQSTLQAEIMPIAYNIAYIDGNYIVLGRNNNKIVLAYSPDLKGPWQYTVATQEFNSDYDWNKARPFKWENKLCFYLWYAHYNSRSIYFYSLSNVTDTNLVREFYLDADYCSDPISDFFDFAKCYDKGLLFLIKDSKKYDQSTVSVTACLSSTFKGDAKSLPTIRVDGTNAFVKAQS